MPRTGCLCPERGASTRGWAHACLPPERGVPRTGCTQPHSPSPGIAYPVAPLATVVLLVVWIGAGGGIALQLVWPDHPKWVAVLVSVALGWVAVSTLTQLPGTIGWGAIAALVASGALYTTGGVIYARERPNPKPGVFGYHELFHAFVLAAAAIHYAVVAFVVLPLG